MMITRENIAIHELIGLHVEVASASDRDMIGISGVVVDETKNTLVLEREGTEKIIPKAHTDFVFTLPGNEHVELDGSRIVARPEDRPKKLWGKRR